MAGGKTVNGIKLLKQLYIFPNTRGVLDAEFLFNNKPSTPRVFQIRSNQGNVVKSDSSMRKRY